MRTAQRIKAIDKLRRGYITRFTKVFKNAFKREQSKLFAFATADTVEGMAGQIVQNVTRFYDFTTQYEQLYLEIYPVTAGIIFDGLIPKKEKSDPIHFAEWEREALRFVANELGDMITAVELFSHDIVVRHTRSVAERAIKEGWGTGRFATELRAELNTLDLFRSIRIARTEVMNAASIGNHNGAVTTGLKLSKTWLTVPGQGDRHGQDAAYFGLNNQTVPMNKVFTLTAGITAQHPHATTLPAKEIINCVCTAIYTPIG